MIVAAFISDRVDQHLPSCIESFDRNVIGDIAATFLVDDRDHHLGLAGAVRSAWSWALEQDCDYLLHIEEDFTFDIPVNVEDLRYILEHDHRLAQVVLLRQAWSDEEKLAGGLVEADAGAYVEHSSWGHHWLAHRRIFSLNPCLIPRRVLELGWPAGNEAEFTAMCLDAGMRFAIFGQWGDPPRVTHHGHQRGAGWRL